MPTRVALTLHELRTAIQAHLLTLHPVHNAVLMHTMRRPFTAAQGI